MVLKEQDPSTAEWMSSESAMRLLTSKEALPRGAMLFAQCPVCQSVFRRETAKFRSRPHAQHACSNACSAQLRCQGHSVQLQCAQCGTGFSRALGEHERRLERGDAAHFCSGECYGRYRARVYTGEAHHRYSQVALTCAWCAKEFTRKKSMAGPAKSAQVFCTVGCYQDWVRSVGGPHTIAKAAHGRGPRSYPPEFKRARRDMLRDSTPCAACGAEATIVHHKDEDKENQAQSNLAPVCARCHMYHHTRTPLPELST